MYGFHGLSAPAGDGGQLTRSEGGVAGHAHRLNVVREADWARQLQQGDVVDVEVVVELRICVDLRHLDDLLAGGGLCRLEPVTRT